MIPMPNLQKNYFRRRTVSLSSREKRWRCGPEGEVLDLCRDIYWKWIWDEIRRRSTFGILHSFSTFSRNMIGKSLVRIDNV